MRGATQDLRCFKYQQRDGLTREVEPNSRFAIVERKEPGGIEQGEVSSLFQFCILLGRGLLRRAKPLPRRKSIAVRFIDPEVLHPSRAGFWRKSSQRQL